ncbi:hypothetical protein A6F55_24820 [Prescottella equi]|uniref:hypothetical protein n=1 Tax=Rhodococcus hoagii TaxID=43767 RepID=UPI000A0F78CC|nr:hypothetical protein [Prescottella equi]ORJ91983.1 hypothetical protein A6F55_24820 [Prescottella equi]
MAADQYGFDTVALPDLAVRTKELRDCILDALDREGIGTLSLAMQTAILNGMEIVGDLEARVARLEDHHNASKAK